MNVLQSPRVLEALASAPLPVQKAFIKQLKHLARDLMHPPLRAKKFDEAQDRWQARDSDDWRFYFRIEGDVYRILDLIPHPK